VKQSTPARVFADKHLVGRCGPDPLLDAKALATEVYYGAKFPIGSPVAARERPSARMLHSNPAAVGPVTGRSGFAQAAVS